MSDRVNNPFVQDETAILLAASENYRAERMGQEPDPERSWIELPFTASDLLSDRAIADAQVREAEINVAARVVGHLAILEDVIEEGGFMGVIARFERRVTQIAERSYLGLIPEDMVERVRDHRQNYRRIPTRVR